jgi:co-chaperonin GroES (HSP10)
MYKPTRNNLIVTEEHEDLSTTIAIPDTVLKDRKQICTVVAVGPKVKDIAVGDRVLAAIWGGTPLEDGERKLRLLDDGSILAKLHDS